ncbi:hypothetical protein KPH14_006467 [Odynerus spinipes]|uniref:SURF1-like protein n=1 Tax=Odynerus spinipes TaxID=1348599 RepID=A0AAD9RQE6_9HYME|nr:hypothetical protein KPH14_006467 [Odynerus spinipes]
MNFTCIRNFSNLAKRTLVNHCQYKDKGRLLLFNNVKIHVINRSKVSRPSLYDTSRKNNKSINLYGYFLLGVPISTFLLGTWQLRRRQWKLQLIEDLKSQMNMKPVDLVENIEQLDSMEYHMVKVRGKFLHEKEFFLGPRSLTSHGNYANSGSLFSRRMTSGWHVITPFKVEDQDLTILVNRGWIPHNAKSLPLSKVENTVEITGVVRKEEQHSSFVPANDPEGGQWCYRDIKTMADIAGTSPVYVDLWSKQDPSNGPISCQTNINVRNEHFTYMITWYTLSVCTALMWYQAFIKKIPVF